MAGNTRVNPETQVRSPARSFAQSLDNFYAPSRDRRKEQAFQDGVNAFGGIFEQKAAEVKKERNDDEFTQGVLDAMREEAGQELKGVKTGSIFRQHSKYYMAGLNETRGKAAASKFKSNFALAYEEWDGKHTDDDGSAFREWANTQVAEFMTSLGDDKYKIAGAMPLIDEVTRNYATQHTGFTATRLEQESFEAYDEIVSGVFTDLSTGALDMDAAIDRIGEEADDMYMTDGAKANDRVVSAAIRYANIHNDPDAILTLAKAHDNGRLKLSQVNREKLANAMDAVEADIERETSKRTAKETAEEKAQRKAQLNAWGSTLAEDPYAELPTFSEVGDQQTYREMVSLQDAFIKGSTVDNPAATNLQRMALEADLHGATTASEKIKVLTEFTLSNPSALSGADVSRYTQDIFATTDPGHLVNNQTVSKYRAGFGQTLAEYQLGDGFDINRSSYLRTQGEVHFNDYLMSKAGKIDHTDPKALRETINEAKEYAMEQLAFQFPEVLREKNEQSPLGDSLGADDALATRDKVVEEQAAAFYQQQAGGSEEEAEELPLEEQPEPFEDPDDEEVYPPVREGFYGEIIHRFTDGRDDRNLLANAVQIAHDDPEFGDAVNNLAAKYDIPPAALMAVMDFETSGTFSTGVKNGAGSGATGLIQFMPKTAASLGTSVEELAAMSRVEQMAYVEKYLDQYSGRIRGGEVDDVYMAVLYPKAIGKPDGYPLFKSGTKAYEQNKGLDTNGDGQVTKFEAAAKVKAKFYGY